MHKRLAVLLFILGVCLIACALLLAGYNLYCDIHAGNFSDEAFAQWEADSSCSISTEDSASDTETFRTTITTIDGYDYIGCLSLPTLRLNLPIMSGWSYAQLKLAPCRQFGAVETHNLVIAAHNYRSHFGHLAQLKIGDPVQFMDTKGTIFYTVAAIKILSPQAVDAVQNSGYPLVLYTCTLHGKARVAVFCQFAV